MDDSNQIPYGYCHCGCGEKAPLARQTDTARGAVKGKPQRFIRGHFRTPRVPIEQRFWKYVRKTDTCWLWTGGKNDKGYGLTNIGTQHHYAHRMAYQLVVGPIPEGLELDHLCRVPSCVNPEHLEPVTHAENMRRGHGVGGRNARKTHCKYGHPFDAENTMYNVRGDRVCRVCNRRRCREGYLRRTAA